MYDMIPASNLGHALVKETGKKIQDYNTLSKVETGDMKRVPAVLKVRRLAAVPVSCER